MHVILKGLNLNLDTTASINIKTDARWKQLVIKKGPAKSAMAMRPNTSNIDQTLQI